MLFQSPFHYNECGREKFANEKSHEMTFQNRNIPLDISFQLKSRMQCGVGTFLEIGFPNISINSNLLRAIILFFKNENAIAAL